MDLVSLQCSFNVSESLQSVQEMLPTKERNDFFVRTEVDIESFLHENSFPLKFCVELRSSKQVKLGKFQLPINQVN